MKNKINKFKETDRREEIVRGLLSGMDADIVALDGSLPDVSVKRVGRLMSGGRIDLSVPDSEKCFLETDSEDVFYFPNDHFYGPCIMYREEMKNPRKQAMKEKSYYFLVKLEGQRSRNKQT